MSEKILFFYLFIGHRKSQCITQDSICNGIYECIDRSDEVNCLSILNPALKPKTSWKVNDFEIWTFKNKQKLKMQNNIIRYKTKIGDKIINATVQLLKDSQFLINNDASICFQTENLSNVISELKECDIGDNIKGLGFPDLNICIIYTIWCIPELQFGENSNLTSCPSLQKLRTDLNFCRNFTFWKDKTCTEYFVRNKGSIVGQCLFEKYCICSEDETCYLPPDKSSMICPLDDSHCRRHDYWHCKDNKTCIPESLLCDGYEHCPDKSDENKA